MSNYLKKKVLLSEFHLKNVDVEETCYNIPNQLKEVLPFYMLRKMTPLVMNLNNASLFHHTCCLIMNFTIFLLITNVVVKGPTFGASLFVSFFFFTPSTPSRILL